MLLPAHISVCAPSRDLWELIDHFQWIRFDLALPEAFEERILPTPRYSFVFQLGDPYQGRHDARPGYRTYPRGLVATPAEYPVTVRPTGSTLALRVVMRPYTAELVLRTSASNVRNIVPDIGELLGCHAQDLVDAMRERPEAEHCIALFETWLRRQIANNRARCMPQMRHAIDRLAQTRGQLRISALADELGISERQLERWFLRSVGQRPKFFQRVVRVNAVIDHVRDERAPIDWAAVALHHGFADQSHLVREFAALAGETPTAYIKNVQFMRLVFQQTLTSRVLEDDSLRSTLPPQLVARFVTDRIAAVRNDGIAELSAVHSLKKAVSPRSWPASVKT